MKINRNLPEINTKKITGNKETKKKDPVEIKDKVTFEEIKPDENFFKELINIRQQADTSVIKSLVMPIPSQVNPARNEIPVVIIHGTMVTKETIENYQDASLQLGHPVELNTYMTIKEGELMQESCQIISQNINSARVEVAKKHMNELSKVKDNPKKLKEYFGMDSSLYGEHDRKADSIFSLIPGTLNKIDTLLKIDKKELLQSFSGRSKEIEKELASDIKKNWFWQ